MLAYVSNYTTPLIKFDFMNSYILQLSEKNLKYSQKESAKAAGLQELHVAETQG